MSSSVLDRLCGITADVMGVSRAQVNAASSPKTLESWDSTAHLNLVLAIEEQFDVQLSPEEMEAMQNVGQAAAIVEKKLETAKQ